MSGEKILVIDDVELVFSAFKEELERSGYEIDTALSGERALEMAKSKKYDVIFIDMFMPDMDGVQTCKLLKETCPEAKLIAMTGQIYKGLADKELEFLKAGGKIYFLYKPFQKGEILEATKKALSERNN
jgi:CheY-like chemotaxis protein